MTTHGSLEEKEKTKHKKTTLGPDGTPLSAPTHVGKNELGKSETPVVPFPLASQRLKEMEMHLLLFPPHLKV